jgi:putative ABC transport system substrate-binding protein
MKRRQFITLFGGAAAAWPLAARAQQPAMPVIGLLTLTDLILAAPNIAAFRQGLNETGFTEGRNVAIETRNAEGQFDRLPALTADLVRRRVAVIAANAGLVVAQTAKAATATIPIVFHYGGDPVKDGLVASFNRPGGNVTGVTFLANVLSGKRLERLHDVLPDAVVIGVLTNPNNTNAETDLVDTQAAARSLGLQLIILKASSEREIDVAFATLVQQHATTLFVSADAFFGTPARRNQIVALALRHGVATCFGASEQVRTGGLMSYADNRQDSYRQFGVTTGRILKGATPADFPVIQPTKFELVINLTTAKALGLTISKEVLLLADEVIE